MKKNASYICLSVIGFLICVIPPAFATIQSFPVFINKSASATVSGLSLVILMICAIPLFKSIKQHLKTPAIPLLWGAMAIILLMVRQIIDQVCIIMVVGAISNTIGFAIFMIRNKKCYSGNSDAVDRS